MKDPRRRDRTRPLELLGLSAAVALFVGGAVMLASRQWQVALVFGGLAFIVSLVVLAMLLLAVVPPPSDDADHDADPGH